MNVLVNGEIVLYGAVGADFWGDSFSPRDVLLALAEIGDETDVTVRLNSGGGIAMDGVAIYSALRSHGGKVTVVVDGIAASAASVIAMAGDDIVMRTGALMMIHDPATFSFGNAEDLETDAATLSKMGDQMAAIYAKKAGGAVEQWRERMRAETWFNPDEAVAAGLADRSDEEKAIKPTAFDYRVYSNSPKPLRAMATALAKAGKLPVVQAAASNQESSVTKPNDTADKKPTDQTDIDAARANAAIEAKARVSKILNADAAKGREELAKSLAFDMDVTAEQAITILEKAPKASANEQKPQANGLGIELMDGARPQAGSPWSAAVTSYNKNFGA